MQAETTTMTRSKSEAERTDGVTKRDTSVTIHMATSLDGYIAREDGRVDWMETNDEFKDEEALDPDYVRTFLNRIDCYVMGSKTYLTALQFESKGLGWSYGDKPIFVLTSQQFVKTSPTVEFMLAT